ncbi:TspO/MBR family protein [Nocardioides pantholopis]|uniref:TspO/MBR family protein n=1 Tax=Nocardioides pantholopis TaxID=2483798 RepID=UPI000FD967FB|nr:TspO/MBR family protein [Nocardioides pantholopis]
MRSYAVTGLLTAAAAAVGSAGVRTDTRWYRRLDKPAWQPPGAAFPLVWTPLYVLVGWGTGRALDRARDTGEDRRVLALTTANLAANAGWNWAFFAARSPASGLAVIAVLDTLNVALVREAARQDRAAAAALTPYAVWCGFATVLNAAIWWRNRGK